MNTEIMRVTLSFEGNDSDNHEINFYDVAEALRGFQRSLAITTHLVLNGEVITKAPALKNANIIALPPEEGSWKFIATIMLTAQATYSVSTAPKETPLGHLAHSVYDYVISEALGFHVDYDKSLGQQYEEMQKIEGDLTIPKVSVAQLDSAIEKSSTAIRDMHRPIVKSKTANRAGIITNFGGTDKPLSQPLNEDTYSHIAFTQQRDYTEEVIGRISSFDSNTNRGRIFIPEEQRTIPFSLEDTAQSASDQLLIVKSLHRNVKDRYDETGNIILTVFKNMSRTENLKFLTVLDIGELPHEHR